MKLYVDDLRAIPPGWTGARTVADAIALLDGENVEEVSLDYVIGDSFDENFAPVARHIAAMPPARRPRTVRLHTSSAAGARALESILRGAVEQIHFLT